MEVYKQLIHAEIAHTLTQVREEYWIPQGWMEVRNALSRCLICLKHEGPSFSFQHMPPWPCERVSQSDVFNSWVWIIWDLFYEGSEWSL